MSVPEVLTALTLLEESDLPLTILDPHLNGGKEVINTKEELNSFLEGWAFGSFFGEDQQ